MSSAIKLQTVLSQANLYEAISQYLQSKGVSIGDSKIEIAFTVGRKTATRAASTTAVVYIESNEQLTKAIVEDVVTNGAVCGGTTEEEVSTPVTEVTEPVVEELVVTETVTEEVEPTPEPVIEPVVDDASDAAPVDEIAEDETQVEEEVAQGIPAVVTKSTLFGS